jgi:hypothetical protein
MFWLDRNRCQPGPDESAEEDATSAQPDPFQGRRGPAPHVVVSGRQLREEILSYGPAFLEPHRFNEPDAFRALVTVLAAYALGSRTAARLVRERQMADPTWQPPSRREAMQVVSSLNRLRQYLPYLLGQRMQATQAAGPGQTAYPPPTPPPAPYRPSPAPPPRPSYHPTPPPTAAALGGYAVPAPPPVSSTTPTTYYSPPAPAAPAATSPGYGQPPGTAYGAVPANYRTPESGMHTPRPAVVPTPQKVSAPVVNARPPAPKGSSGVVVRPVISLNRRTR